MPEGLGTEVLSLQGQLADSERWPSTALGYWQERQLALLLGHARATVPFYRGLPVKRLVRPDGGLDADAWAELPLLSRRDLQTSREALWSTAVPARHGEVLEGGTTGSTAMPLRVRSTALCSFLQQSIVVRDHLWHRRDLRGKLATIGTKLADGTSGSWNPALDAAFETGPVARRNARHDVAEHAAWLAAENPSYLLLFPTIADALARHCVEHGIEVPGLVEVRTFGEHLRAGLREAVRAAWGARLTDTYSCAEVGTIALQCPEHEHYHAQSEFVRLEVLAEDGRPCRPGEIGRVVLTALHNFAMPLIRYDLQDWAEVGEACPCGRGLTVLRRIMGRQRNMILAPDGRRFWPRVVGFSRMRTQVVRQWQLVQERPERLDLRLVADRPLTPDEEGELFDRLRSSLGYPFRFAIAYVDEIARSGEKYEDVVSTLAADV